MNIMRTRTALFATTGLAAFALILACRLAAQSDRAEAQQNPFAGQSAAIAAGKTLYAAQCQSCHPTGIATYQRGSADGEIFLNIRNGIRNTTMAPYTQLSTDQIWQIVAYMKTLTPAAATPATIAAASAAGDTANGKLVFEGKAACLTCHQFN